MQKGTRGGSLGGRPQVSPARARRQAAARRAQDQRWAAKAGEVQVAYACICPRDGCRADHPAPESPPPAT